MPVRLRPPAGYHYLVAGWGTDGVLDVCGGRSPTGVGRRVAGAVHVHVTHGGQGAAGAGQAQGGSDKFNPNSEIELPQKNTQSAKTVTQE